MLTRRIAIGGSIASAGLFAIGGRAQRPAPIAVTAQGRVCGLIERGACAFRGIPYGGDVATPAHRFKAPPPPPRWTGVRDATVYGAPAMQPGTSPGEPDPAENCLFLNVWTPAIDGRRRPVMFYCHGGGFTIGSGARMGQNGANLARTQDVVVVETNHRLGIFGYLYFGALLGPDYSGNQGLLDLVAGLRWVRENIAGFGGDPANVMIFGEGGGGGKITCLYGMPDAAPLFTKASIESPIGPTQWSPAQATEVARATMRAFGFTDPRRLLDVPAAALIRFQTSGNPAAAVPGSRRPGSPPDHRDQLFWPMIDGRILPELPFGTHAPTISADKPLVIGGCKDEAVFFNFGDPSAFRLTMAELRARLAGQFGDRTDAWIETFRRTRPGASPSELYMAITTAAPWRAHAVRIAELKARQGRAPVYSYILDYRTPIAVPGTDYPAGSFHASDIATKFDNVAPPPGLPSPPATNPFADASPARIQASRNMSAMWAAFARTGNPSIPGQPAWKPYTLATRDTMLIDAQCTLVSDPEGDERRFWETQPDPERIY